MEGIVMNTTAYKTRACGCGRALGSMAVVCILGDNAPPTNSCGLLFRFHPGLAGTVLPRSMPYALCPNISTGWCSPPTSPPWIQS